MTTSKIEHYLSRFDFTLKHILETRIVKVDRLSRRLDWKVGIEIDDKNKTNKKIKGKDEEVVREIEKTNIKTFRGHKWEIDSKLVSKECSMF